jgi:hypothetical protein
MKQPRVIILAIALLTAASALAQPAAKKVFRCSVNARVVYSDAPCKDGTEVQADDARTEAQRQNARDNVEREKKRAEQMGAERRAEEAAAAKQGAGRIPYSAAIKAAEPAAPASSAVHKFKHAPKKPKSASAPAQP